MTSNQKKSTTEPWLDDLLLIQAQFNQGMVMKDFYYTYKTTVDKDRVVDQKHVFDIDVEFGSQPNTIKINFFDTTYKCHLELTDAEAELFFTLFRQVMSPFENLPFTRAVRDSITRHGIQLLHDFLKEVRPTWDVYVDGSGSIVDTDLESDG